MSYVEYNESDLPRDNGCTSLGNQCNSDGSPEIMKALLEAGADPNAYTKVGVHEVAPLTNLLFPDNYCKETHTFLPHTESKFERAKLLIKAGADINLRDDRWPPAFGLSLVFGVGEIRKKLIMLFLENGLDVDSALENLERWKKSIDASREYDYALYEFHAGFTDITQPILELGKYIDLEKSMHHLKLSADSGYAPAQKRLAEYEPQPACLD